jgi:predicted XRE-type DNA-binding protein
MAERTEQVTVETTLGSVYEALGYPNHEEMVRKATLVNAIGEIMEARGLTQARVAEIAGIDQPTLSKLLRGRFRSISTDKLTDILNALGQSVTVVVSGTLGEKGGDYERGHAGVVVVEGLFTVDRERVKGPAAIVGSNGGSAIGA